MALAPSHVSILPNDVRRLRRLLHVNINALEVELVGEDGLLVGVLVVEGAKEVLRRCQLVVVVFLERGHFQFNIVGFVELTGHQEVGSLLEQTHQLVVVEGQL